MLQYIFMSKSKQSPPYEVENAIKAFGEGLRIARIRRRKRIKDIAERLGIGIKIISNAEKGKLTSSIVVYVSLLWAYDLLDDFKSLADPFTDKEGLSLMMLNQKKKVRKSKSLDSNF